MATIVLEKLKQPVFNLFYIMTEGVQVDAGFAAYRKTVFLLFVDVLQVLRVMCSLRYGWTEDTLGIIQKTDIVYMFTTLVSNLIPRYSFFILAAILVLVALLDSYYVVQLFKAGNMQKLWPVKLLRFLVASLVTILFSSVIKWLLIPIECLVSEEKSFSDFIHNTEDLCSPWAMPEVIVSIPTIVLAAAYIIFALGTSYLSFEINPLSRNPRAMYTGRVELLFTFNKVAVTLLVYLSDLVTPVVISIIFFLWTFHVFHQHLKILPYHSEVTNYVRGGIYGMVLWWSFATTIVASIKVSRNQNDEWATEKHPDWLQPMQWALAGMIPLAFVLGLSLTASTQHRAGRSLLRLRGDFEKPPSGGLISPDVNPANRGDSSGRGSITNLQLPLQSMHVPRVGLKRGVFEKFFDTEWESRRRFSNEWRAVVLLRSLLQRRSKDDILFMQYLVGKAIQEHPESTLLQLQLLVLHRFVFRDASEAAELQRALKLDQKTLPIDCQYILFVAERKSNQAIRGTDLGGGGTVTGIRLMEFDISFERARKAHFACVSKMRAFWRHVEKKRTASLDTMQAMDLVKSLEEYEEESSVAKKEYELLIEKYPQSVQLLRSYAHFCDTVINDVKTSEAFQKTATLLEGDGDEEVREEEEENRENCSKEFAAEKEGGGSTYSSEAEPYRVAIQRYLLSHSELMMGPEAHAVNTLHRRVGLALLILLVITTAGFVLNDNYLFSGLALRNMDQIDKTGLLRSYALNAAFLLRGIQLASIYNNTAQYEQDVKSIGQMMETWRKRHRENYEGSSSKLRDYYLESELQSEVPVEGIWTRRWSNFWVLGNEFARRAERAAQIPMHELKDPSFRLGTMSYEKENMAYVYENLERETRKDLRVVVDIFQDEMEQFGILATALVICNVCINAVLVLLISFFVLRALAREMRTMQSALVFCSLALSLPRSTANTVYRYYDTVELNMKIVEDEEAERNAIMQSDINLLRKSSVVGAEGSKTASIRRSSAQDEEAMIGMNMKFPGNIGRRPSSMMPPSSSELVDNRPGSPLTQSFLKALELEGAENSGGSSGVGAVKPCKNVERWLTRELKELPEARGGDAGLHILHAMQVLENNVENAGEQSGEGERQSTRGREESLSLAQPEPDVSEGESERDSGEGRGVWEDSRAGKCEEAVMILDEKPCNLREQPIEGHSKRTEQNQEGWSSRSGIVSASDEEENTRSGVMSPGLEEESNRSWRRSPVDNEEGRRSGRSGNRRSHGKEEEGSRRRSVTLQAEAEEWVTMSEGVLRAARAKVRKVIMMHQHRELRMDKADEPFPPNHTGNQTHGKPERGDNRENAAKKSAGALSRVYGSIVNYCSAPAARPTQSSVATDGRPENFLGESGESLAIVVQTQQPWRTRVEVYFVVCVAVLTICIFSMAYPSRHIDDIVNLAPIANQAGRRRSLASSCVHYARELVLDDGLSRMTKEETAGSLRFYLEELRKADTAVRMGGAAGIRVGSDYRNKEHNDVMYGEGCAWRKDPTDCSMPGFEGRHDVAMHGLSYLLKSFEDAVETVLARYAPGLGDNLDWLEHRPVMATADMFAEVHTTAKRVDLLTEDPDLKFIMVAYDGDVMLGLGEMLSIFRDETSHVLQKSQAETRLLFGVYVSVVGLLFYLSLFRRTIKLALSQVDRTRGLVMSMPTHVLKKESVQAIVHFFAPTDKTHQDEDDQEALDTMALNQAQPTTVAMELENQQAELARKMAKLQQEQDNLKHVV